MTELEDVSDSNPDAHGRVSSNLTSRTIYRTGVMGAHLALTQEDEDRNLGAVPYGSIAKLVKATDCKSVIARSNRAGTSTCRVMPDGSGTSFESCGWLQKPWGSAPPPGAKSYLQCCQSGNGSAWKAAAWLKGQRRFDPFTLRQMLDDVRRL